MGTEREKQKAKRNGGKIDGAYDPKRDSEGFLFLVI